MRNTHEGQLRRESVSKKLVREYYSKDCLYEWRRLVQDPYHRLELDTTLHFLRKYLPAKGLVLDAGGGPGRYTIELAKQGYDVILLDLTPGLLEIARKQIGRAGVKEKVKAVVMGSIDNLNVLPDNHFDAVLCLGGAFSHLVDRRNRNRAGAELVRVAKKKAPVFISVAGRPAKFVNALERGDYSRQTTSSGAIRFVMATTVAATASPPPISSPPPN
jgi:ubiquinone/menaquinone biosynthesis C-methylase UbiE